MKKQLLLRSLVFLFGIALCNSLFSQVTFQGVSDSTAILNETFTANVSYTILGGGTPTFSLPTKPGDMSINSSGVITFHPLIISGGGRVVVRAVNTSGTYEFHFNVYVSNAISCSANLISYFKLDEPGGTSFADYAGGYTATSSVSLGDVDGMVDGGVSMTPASINTDYMHVSDVNQYERSVIQPFSYSLWIYSYGKPAWAMNQAIDQVFFYREDATANNMLVIGLDGQNTVTNELFPKFRVRSNGVTETIVSTTAITANQWHHLAFVYYPEGTSGTHRKRIYLDGALIDNPQTYLDPAYNFYMDSPLSIGYYSGMPDDNFPFSGRMDEILIYNSAIDAQISTIYADGLAGEAHCKPGNHAPELVNNFPATINQGAVYNQLLTAYDVEGTTVTIDTVSLPHWMTYSSGTKRLTNKASRPNNSDVGVGSIVLSLSDGTATVQRTFPVTVINVNDAPVFTSTNPTSTMNEDAHYVYNITYNDVDLGDVVTLSAQTKPNWLTLNTTTRVLSGIPTNDTLGTSANRVFNVVLRLNDGDVTTDQSFTITVNNVNDAPIITGQNIIYTPEHIPITITPALAFTEGVNFEDGDDVFPTDFSITVQAGTNYTVTSTNVVNPVEFFSGFLSVPIVVSDGTATTNYTLIVNVNAVNEIPNIESTPVTTADDYVYYEYEFIATDGDPEDVLTMADSVLPSWLSFDSGTGILSGTPKWNNIGDTVVILTVTDGKVTVVHDFSINVGNTNSIPEITSTPDESASVGEIFQYNLTVNDPDEDNTLTFSAPTKPEWLTFTPEDYDALLHGVPTTENLGTFPILLQVSDNAGGIDQQSFNLIVSLTGIDEETVGTILVYPIPASTSINFEFEAVPINSVIEILNLNGQSLYKQQLETIAGKVEINITEFNPGMYIYRILQSNQIITGKFMVE
jgi:hypothetical protein